MLITPNHLVLDLFGNSFQVYLFHHLSLLS